jgi:ABC-type branched-subunit amino acid transport system permease subunit
MIPSPGPAESLAHMLHWLAIGISAAAAVGAVIAGAMFIWNIKLVDPAPDRSSLSRAVVGLAVAGGASALIGAIT